MCGEEERGGGRREGGSLREGGFRIDGLRGKGDGGALCEICGESLARAPLFSGLVGRLTDSVELRGERAGRGRPVAPRRPRRGGPCRVGRPLRSQQPAGSWLLGACGAKPAATSTTRPSDSYSREAAYAAIWAAVYASICSHMGGCICSHMQPYGRRPDRHSSCLEASPSDEDLTILTDSLVAMTTLFSLRRADFPLSVHGNASVTSKTSVLYAHCNLSNVWVIVWPWDPSHRVSCRNRMLLRKVAPSFVNCSIFCNLPSTSKPAGTNTMSPSP